MFKKFLKLSLVSFLSLAIFSLSMAQRQTGSIVGTVTDEEGVFLPGVSVTIKSPALILPSMSAITSERGIYRFPSLPPGVYEITYELDGMNTLIRKDISLSVGQTVTLDVTLQLKTLEESIVVVGKAPLIDKQKASLSTHLDSEFIKAIPAGRDLGSYLSMVPGMVREQSIETTDQIWLRGSSGLGSNVRENKFNLDGTNLNDPLMGYQMVEIGVDIMDEVSVEAGGLTAEYGGVTGAVVNVISKSGGNEFSGSATFFFRDESLQSENTKGTPLEGRKSGIKYFYEPSLTLGGPIKRDKLWFFIGASYIRSAQLIPGFPYDKEEDVPAITSYPFAFFKLSFQPDQANKFVLSYNFANDDTNHKLPSQFHTELTTFRWKAPTHALNFHWTRFFTNNFFMNFRANYVNWEGQYLPQEGVTGPSIADLLTGLNIQGQGMELRNLNQTLYNIKVDGTLFADNLAGSHEFKVGAEYNTALSRDIMEATQPFYLIYTIFGTPYMGMEYRNLHNKFKDQDAHFFIQDTWTVSKRLTFNLGARLSRQWLTVPKQNEDEGPQSIAGIPFNRSVTEALTLTKWTNIDPRVGLIFDITGDGKTLFKASYGRFTSPLLGLLGSYGNPNSWAYAAYLLAPDLTPLFPISVGIPQKAKTEYGSHKLSAPYVDEITVALERDIIGNLSAGIRYIRKRHRNIYMAVDANSLDLDRLMDNGELIWINWEQVPFVDPYDGQQKFFWSQKQLLPPDLYYLNPPVAYRDFDAVEVNLTKRYSDGWFLMASYIWGHARGLMDQGYWGGEISWTVAGYYTDPNIRVNSIGRLDLDRRHQFKFQGLLEGPLGINVSGFIRFLSGTRYTRTVNSLELGIPVAQGQATINAEEKGSRGYPGSFTADLRLEKIFRADKVSLGVFVDAFNLFNSGKATAYNLSSSNPVLTFEEMIAIENPRVIRLGARIEF